MFKNKLRNVKRLLKNCPKLTELKNPLLQKPMTAHVLTASHFNPLPNNKNLDLFKSKGFADNKINVYEKLKFDLVRVENIVGKGENAGNQHFLLFPLCFPKPASLGLLK